MAILVLRKAWRLGAIIFPLTYYFTNKITSLFVILPFLCIFIVLEILRFFIFRFNERLFISFRYILKEKEKKTLLSTTWFLLSVFLTVILFSKDIAIAAILFLIFSDASADIIGSKFGHIRILKTRTLEGSLAFFITCLIIGIIINFTKINLGFSVFIGGALAATVIELLPLPIEDNFTIALFSGIIMTILSR